MRYVDAIKFENERDNANHPQTPLVFESYERAMFVLHAMRPQPAAHHQRYSRKQVEVLDVTGGAIIDFLYDIRKEFPNVRMGDFVDEVLFPNIYWDKCSEGDDDEDPQFQDD